MRDVEKKIVEQLRRAIKTVPRVRHKQLIENAASLIEAQCVTIDRLKATTITPAEFGSLLSKFCTDLKAKK